MAGSTKTNSVPTYRLFMPFQSKSSSSKKRASREQVSKEVSKKVLTASVANIYPISSGIDKAFKNNAVPFANAATGPPLNSPDTPMHAKANTASIPSTNIAPYETYLTSLYDRICLDVVPLLTIL